MFCQPIYKQGVLTCAACGVEFRSVTAADLAAIGGNLSKIRRGCVLLPSLPDVARETMPPPSPGRRAANFAKAALRHVTHGMPKCTQEQIDARLAICQGCELYQLDPRTAGKPPSGTCTHEACGCTLTRSARFRNKLAWADQECPLGKWGPLSGDGL